MFGINAALGYEQKKNRCASQHRRSLSFPALFIGGPGSEALRGCAVGENVEAYRLTVDEQGVLRIDARAGGLDLLPGRSSSEVFAPPRERPALLWSDLVNVALFVLVQVDANAVVLPALQNIATVVGLPSVPLEPCFD